MRGNIFLSNQTISWSYFLQYHESNFRHMRANHNMSVWSSQWAATLGLWLRVGSCDLNSISWCLLILLCQLSSSLSPSVTNCRLDRLPIILPTFPVVSCILLFFQLMTGWPSTPVQHHQIFADVASQLYCQLMCPINLHTDTCLIAVFLRIQPHNSSLFLFFSCSYWSFFS